MNSSSTISASRTNQPKATPEDTQLEVQVETKVVVKNVKKRRIEETTCSISNLNSKGSNPKKLC